MISPRVLKISALLVFLTAAALSAQSGLLGGKYAPEEIQHLLIPREQWTPFPPIEDRDAWEIKTDRRALDEYVKFAEKNIGYQWPTIPATLSLAFVRDGNRSKYEAISYRKRIMLAAFLVAELAENKGRFIDPIINGVWAICEESWWGASAHLPKRKSHAGLVDTADPRVDLFAATSAELLAWTDYFLGKKFDAVSPQIRKRIRREINTRILQPAMNIHHRWMGGDPKYPTPNNWNPWICSNWLAVALLLEKDETARAAHVARILTVLDNFITPYPRDGGCDEGPGYWNASGASVYDCLSLLNSATNGAFRYAFSDKKIQNMGKYIYRVQVSDKTRYVISFADSPPRATGEGATVYRFGKDIGDTAMMEFAAANRDRYRARNWRVHYARIFHDLLIRTELEAVTPRAPLPRDVWFPDLQVAAARDKDGSDAGFYFAAKGGHNGESHNHNDIGNFIVFYDGQPLLIDAGQGTYTAKTFGARRYELWNNNSDHHNVPSINGVAQKAGKQYQARSVRHSANTRVAEFSADIAPAYPESAGVKSWRRTITLNRGQNIRVTDETELEKTDHIIEHLMSCHPAEVTAPNEVTISGKDGAGNPADFLVKLTGAPADIEIEKLELNEPEDEHFRRRWTPGIFRISFKITSPSKAGQYTLEITKKN